MTTVQHKILILGNGGSGKTTLALQLQQQLRVPLLHLDAIYWQSDWQHSSADFFAEKLHATLQKPAWIIEGTPMRLLQKRLQHADLIIFLDLKRATCIKRFLFRSLKSLLHNKNNSGCPAKAFSLKALKWIWTFKQKTRPVIFQHLNNLPAHKVLHIVDAFKHPQSVVMLHKSKVACMRLSTIRESSQL